MLCSLRVTDENRGIEAIETWPEATKIPVQPCYAISAQNDSGP